MKLAVMQPYFFPYIGYFSLIHSVDHFMFFDDVQYLRKSWMSRNRLLNIEKNVPFYIRPDIIKPPYKSLLPTVELVKNEKWKVKIIEQIKGYKNKAPYFKETHNMIEEILEKNYNYLVDFNSSSIMDICDRLGIHVNFDNYSNHNFWFKSKPGPGDWGKEISRAMGAKAYINSPGGENFIFAEDFEKIGVRLGFLQNDLHAYNQENNDFVSGLSIIDVLMFCGIEGTKAYLTNYRINWKN